MILSCPRGALPAIACRIGTVGGLSTLGLAAVLYEAHARVGRCDANPPGGRRADLCCPDDAYDIT
jgi:hypothetical protein